MSRNKNESDCFINNFVKAMRTKNHYFFKSNTVEC